MSEQTDVPQYWDLISKRDPVTKEPGMRDATLFIDQDSIQFIDGFAHNVPTRIVEKLSHRRDLQVVPAADPPTEPVPEHQSPASRPESARPAAADQGPSVAEQLRQAMAGTGATPIVEDVEPEVAVGERDPATGHRRPPGKPEVSLQEKWDRARQALEETKAQGEAGLEGELVEGSEGGPVFVPAGTKLGTTPGWPVDDQGRPLELTPPERDALVNEGIASGAVTEGEGGTGDDNTPATTPEPPPIPQGFSPTLESGERRCLAAKADKSQCSNAAKDGTWACAMPAHQEKVQQLYADQA